MGLVIVTPFCVIKTGNVIVQISKNKEVFSANLPVFQPQEVGFDVSSNAEYVLSQVDATELMLIGNSAAEMSRSLSC